MDLRNELYKTENESYRKSLLDVAAYGSVTVGAIYAVNKLSNNVVIPWISVDKLRFLGLQTIEGQTWYSSLGKAASDGATAKEVFLNTIKILEESLFKMPRAFSTYAQLSEGYLSEELTSATGEHFISGNILSRQAEYLASISEGKITPEMAKRGLLFRASRSSNLAQQLLPTYQLVDTSTGEVVLNNAKVGFNYWNKAIDELQAGSGAKSRGFIPRYAQAAATKARAAVSDADIWVTGGQSALKSVVEKVSANIHVGVQNYMKLLDDPFEVVTKGLESFIGGNNPGSTLLRKGSQFWDTLGMRNVLGVGGWEQLAKGGNSINLMTRHLSRSLPVLAAGVLAFKTADELLRRVPIVKDTVLGSGLKGIAATAYQDATLAYTGVTDFVGLGAYTRKQEEKAPGSTSFKGLAALPLSLAIAGGTIGGLMNLTDKNIAADAKGAAPRILQEAAEYLEGGSDTLGKVARSLKLTSKGRTGAFAMVGAIAGTAAILPFLPGALGSTTSVDELSDIYSGEKLVPVRQGRKWEFGITPYEGDDIMYHEVHPTVRMITDAAKKSKYGKYYGRPLTRMLNRVLDPYYLERHMDEERPYMYWGPTDQGFGFLEKLASPVKEMFKPTILAHEEALTTAHPGRIKRFSDTPPDSVEGTEYGTSMNNFLPDVLPSNSQKAAVGDTIRSFKTMLGIIGFAHGEAIDSVAGSTGVLFPDAIFESSGRILSSQRSYWDQSFGGMMGLNEFYRRLNPNRQYGPEYVQAAVRNTQPSWLPEQFQYGDPFSQVPQGELRLPGVGYASIHPEVRNTDYEDYPAIFKYDILSNLAPMSREYYRAKHEAEVANAEGRLNRGGKEMFAQIQAREEVLKQDQSGNFDYGGQGIASDYWLKLKQIGRAIPTEHLYPISPVHKFAGPVDPMTDYTSKVLLDSSYKSWSSPVSDYVKPALNRALYDVTLGNYVPGETKQFRKIEDYFEKLQYAKNVKLREGAEEFRQAGDTEAAKYLKSGIRSSVYDVSPMGDLEEQALTINPKHRKYFRAFAEAPKNTRSHTMRVVGPDMQRFLQGQWYSTDAMIKGDFERVNQLTQTMESNQVLPSDITKDMPNRDFVGYAPGVNLNAYKVKMANNLGQNIRDHNLWKEDERQARLLSAIEEGRALSTPVNTYVSEGREAKRKQVQNYLHAIGMRARVSVTPANSSTTVEFHGSENNKERLHTLMQNQGMIVY